jgi:uncharacterized membrane protein YfcA
MSLSSLIKSNIKPLLFHFIVVLIAGMLNIVVWRGSENQQSSFVVLLISLGIYFILGFLIEDEYSVAENIQKVVFIPILSLLLYLGVLIPNSKFEGSIINSFEFLYFLNIQPFLYFTGIPADFNHPFLFSIVPALMLSLGLHMKVVIKSLDQ